MGLYPEQRCLNKIKEYGYALPVQACSTAEKLCAKEDVRLQFAQLPKDQAYSFSAEPAARAFRCLNTHFPGVVAEKQIGYLANARRHKCEECSNLLPVNALHRKRPFIFIVVCFLFSFPADT